ncbi:MAG TPA: ABC transporter ATP-binding protein [Citreicella sp.]|jgi:peptide/nickel transport system ATP-binding protein|uniref:Peptide/nickel transport system ATP-binding protein n=1 Tax=Salipiger marinus TaxID=555512 RepID=A0A1G8K9Y7_9RHOB|nr:ABC transporter ATP-binding protein [Salipiger marinus]SDI39630.1 peptide/nickel transport system ATP-binding protein [Salipiger marinus]HBM60226.1 ABC transporter ATP-binding protein [Citreicella sp.]|tara:strand:- start:538 stop:1509 length:972 start_codon:yes stop_codon:yes gene_type:complete
MTPLLDVRDLVTVFPSDGRDLRAVDEVSLQVHRGEVLGLVGESGSGKSVTGFSIMGLVDPPGRIAAGQILFDGSDLAKADPETRRSLRGRRIAMVFQDPMMTLNPVLRIGTQMTETLHAHETLSRQEAHARARDALGQVGIPSPEERLAAYPHQFSGGMRQRVAIAIALLHRPDLIIADEPTTALDVTIQAQIISEFQKLTEDQGTAVIWITHDLAIVSGLADRIAVMYGGRIVETGPITEVLERPRHPYTRGLIRSVPSENTRGTRLAQIPGVTPGLARMPQGCAFRTRCARADSTCAERPGRFGTDQTYHRCFHPHEEALA